MTRERHPADPTAKLREGKGEAAEEAAKAAGISARSVNSAKAVDDADPGLGDEVLAGARGGGGEAEGASGR